MTDRDCAGEAARIMGICNACRYCEGYCPVFPAMERRLEFSLSDLTYLANLCHQCQACYTACQYAPPHEFAVNVPRSFAELRRRSWVDHAWPRALAPLLERAGLWAALASAASLALILIGTALMVDGEVLFAAHAGPGAFYAVIPHQVMVALFGGVFVYVVLALWLGARGFLRAIGADDAAPVTVGDWLAAIRDAATLRHLGGGGDGCPYPGERPANRRRVFHHLTFYGFAFCFAATVAGTVYHYGFGLQAPHGFASAPVVLGLVGGIGLVVGPAGLLWLRAGADPEPLDPGARSMDTAFAVLLILTSITGIALLFARETPAMGLLLAVHLAIVLALFLTLPHGRFVHGIYRLVALVMNAREARAEASPGSGEPAGTAGLYITER
jgi:citrate/tricarballylate utilization protein